METRRGSRSQFWIEGPPEYDFHRAADVGPGIVGVLLEHTPPSHALLVHQREPARIVTTATTYATREGPCREREREREIREFVWRGLL